MLSRFLNLVRFLRLSAAVILTLFLGVTLAYAQVSKSHAKLTELVIMRYERLIDEGALLTPEGWQRASQLFDRSNAYPKNGVIFLVSTGAYVGEGWVKGDRAEVESKWNDFFGTIDSALRYKSPTPDGGSIVMFLVFPMVFVRNDERGATAAEMSGGQWKIATPLTDRSATIDRAIGFVRTQRDKSNDPKIRTNANKTIVILKRLKGQCHSGSAC
jgi:hypothetical protein